LSTVLEAAELGPRALVLIESGPTSTTRFLAEGGVDELFLTRAPIFVGRAGTPATLALVEGKVFSPGELSGRLVSLRRSGDYLFLRYAMNAIEPGRAPSTMRSGWQKDSRSGDGTTG
jgi:riboflavin biosynthesis pyrimidine reductase